MFGSVLVRRGVVAAAALVVLLTGGVVVEASGLGNGVLNTLGINQNQDSTKTTVCHVPGGNANGARTLEVDTDELVEHLDHGDTAGGCVVTALQSTGQGQTIEVRDGKAAICHVPPGNPTDPQTLVVAEDAVGEHLTHGDSPGACAGAATRTQGRPAHAGGDDAELKSGQILVCHHARTRSLSPDALADHLGHGDTTGACS